MSEEQKKVEQADISWANNDAQRMISLPKNMEIAAAIKQLRRKEQELETFVNVCHKFPGSYPGDGAIAFKQAVEDLYGWALLKHGTKMVSVATGINQHVQVPMGRVVPPFFKDDGSYLFAGWTWHKGVPCFELTGEIKRKYEKDVLDLADRMNTYIAQHSIYKGKAIRTSFIDPSEAASLEDFNPEFLDLSGIDPKKLVFSEDVMAQVEVNLFTPVLNTEKCRELNIPLKRGILLAGPYGTGKTMTAFAAAKYATENEWTFIYLRDVEKLHEAIDFAKEYSPAVVFAEDIDEVLGTDSRNSEVNSILNTIDGIDAKNSEIMVVLTTNHADRINRAMLRPGRLDAVIEVTPPDALAAETLVRQYSGDSLSSSDDITAVGKELAGHIPAVIREVVERSKLYSIRYGLNGITPEGLLDSAKGMRDQVQMAKVREPDTRSDIEKAVHPLADALRTLGAPEVASAE